MLLIILFGVVGMSGYFGMGIIYLIWLFIEWVE